MAITTIEDVKVMFESFNSKNGHYPTAKEIDDYFPVSRKLLERKFGGLRNLRKTLGLDIIDYTTGNDRAKKALKSLDISYQDQSRIYKKLLPIFGKYYIHEQSPYADTARQRSDFKIFHKEGEFYIDIFYASTYETMIGCVGAKLKKFNPKLIWGEVILINTNSKLDESIDKMIKNRKTPLPANIKIMSEEQLLSYCRTLKSVV